MNIKLFCFVLFLSLSSDSLSMAMKSAWIQVVKAKSLKISDFQSTAKNSLSVKFVENSRNK